jgi:hypothetical protein
MAARIWTHTQKNLLSKPFTGPVQPFCVSGAQPVDHAVVDEILHDSVDHVEYATGSMQDELLEFDLLPPELHALSLRHSSKFRRKNHVVTAHPDDKNAKKMHENDEELLMVSAQPTQDAPAIRSPALVPEDRRDSAPSGSTVPRVHLVDRPTEHLERTVTDYSNNPNFDDEILFTSEDVCDDLVLSEQQSSRIADR